MHALAKSIRFNQPVYDTNYIRFQS